MKDKKWYPVVYMFACTFVLTLVLIGLARFTRPRVKANEQIAFERAIMSVFDVDLPESNIELHKLFQEKISKPTAGVGGAYVFTDEGVQKGYAIELVGQGFWAPIKAIIGVAADKKSITGFAVYEQNETPGLGAEITKPDFLEQFASEKNKKIGEDDSAFAIKPIGSKLSANEVYAITGATQTSTRLEKIIDEALRSWREEMKQEK